MNRVVCHIDEDKQDRSYDSAESLTSALIQRYGLSSADQIEYKSNGSSMDILVKTKMGSSMRMVGFYYEVTD